MGPGAGASGGEVIAEGTVADIENDPRSKIGPFLSGEKRAERPGKTEESEIFRLGRIRMETGPIHTVHPLTAEIPKGRLTVVTGVSGSGKTTLILEASPIGINVRSTVATYANVHDELRKIFARTEAAKEKGYKAGDFSYNTGRLRCPVCDGTGQISLDVQFLPDVDIPARYGNEARLVRCLCGDGKERSLPELMDMDVHSALAACGRWKTVRQRLQTLDGLGLGYLTLGEETPSLSGGEAQRLKLASEMGRPQSDAVFVFDEPTIGLHPLDVATLLSVFQTLLDQGATVVVIESQDSTYKKKAPARGFLRTACKRERGRKEYCKETKCHREGQMKFDRHVSYRL